MKYAAFLLSSILMPVFGAPEAFEVGPARKDELPKGKEADGIIGDFILRNDQVEAVVSGNLPLRRANMSTFYGENGTTPGCLYDLTLRGVPNDQLTIFQPAQQQGSVSWVRVLKDGKSDGEAAVECIATAPNREGISKRHIYALRDGWQGLQITTIITNEGDKPKKVLAGDRWTTFWRTGVAPIGAGIMWAEAVDPSDRAGYAAGYLQAPPDIGAQKLRELKPGESLSLVRFVAVAKSPAEAVGLVAARQGPVVKLSGTVRDPGGAPVRGASIVVRSAAPPPPIPPVAGEKPAPTTATPSGRMAARTSRAIGIAYTDDQGGYALTLPASTYLLTFNDQGRSEVERSIALNEAATLDIAMSAAGAVQFDIKAEDGGTIPCKAQFLALEGTDRVNLGPDQRAHGCRDQYHSERGQFRVQIPPGKYRIVVTRGIEFSHLAKEITLGAGETAQMSGTLKRLVDTNGWVSADYHNHSTPSGDNTCGTDDRLINLAAEHIEFAPTTEHNRLYDWAPHIERLGLSKFIATVPGMELTGNAAHFNSFPFKPVPRTQDAGAPVWNKDPRITAITLRDWQGADPDRWVQINHPDMAVNFVDANADGRPDGGFRGLATLIDGIETQNNSGSELLGGRPIAIWRDREGKEIVRVFAEFAWLQMLNRGHRYAAMAVCDAHTVWGNGTGGWRMYMPSASDDPASIDWRENSRAAKAGRSYLTNGPFLQVTTDDGTGPGGSTRTLNGKVNLRIRVQCTDWIQIDRVQVLVNGRQMPEGNFTRTKDAAKFADGVVQFEQTITVALSEDAHLIAVATGENSSLRIGYGTSPQGRMKPIAYHNPIFVDVDGHGFTPNGDTLGWPLPTKKISVPEAKRLLTERGFDAKPPEPATEL